MDSFLQGEGDRPSPLDSSDTYLDCLDSILNLVDTTFGGEGVDPTIVLLFAAEMREGLGFGAIGVSGCRVNLPAHPHCY